MAEQQNISVNAATEKLKATLPKVETTNGAATAVAPAPEPKVEAPVKVEAKVESPSTEIKTEAAESDLAKFLKENNFSSIDELKQKITPQRQKTEDEEEAELIDWAVKNENLKVDDFLSAKELQKKKDADIVFENFANKLQAKNKNITAEEIQAKFNKKYGEETTDEDLNIKYVFDDEDIAEQAKLIREQRLQPINNVKSKFKNYTSEQNFVKQVQNEFSEIAKAIPDKISIKIDDKNSLDYEIESKYKETLIPKLNEAYTLFRRNTKEKIDTTAFLSYVADIVKSDNFGNIANIYRQKGIDAAQLEAVKKLENPITDTLNLNKGGQPTVDMKVEAQKLRKNLPKI